MLRRSTATFTDGGRTVVLGRGRWGFLARLRPFRGRLMSVAAILLLISTVYGLRARADTAEYYPSSCLGTWEGVDRALGETELDGSPREEFSSENSARFPGGTAQIFCGNFVGDIASPGETQVFRSATLSFVWSFRFPDDASSSVPLAPSSSLLAPATSSPGGASSSNDVPPLEYQSSSASGTVSFWSRIFTRARAEELPPAPSEPTPPVTSPMPIEESPPTQELSPTVIIPTEPSSSNSAPPSDIGSSTETSATTTGDMVSTSTPSSTLDIPWSIGTPAADPTIVGGSEEDVFQITVSLDGKEWTSLGTVSRGNWQDGAFSLPITSWADLARLQVSIRGLGSPERPEVLLDGMRVEVEYEEPGALGEIFGVLPAPLPPPPPPPPVDIPEAKHRCAVTPFTQTTRPGGQAAFSIELFPSVDGLPYQVALGDLPEGVAGTLSPASGTPPTINLAITAGATTTPGSFSSVVIYRETNASGTTVSTVCQYNLVLSL